ncbi:hypothetical protein BPUM_2933 [Bacillus pumilus SAFR-032]|uniref:Uncharacterized protein n=1 Tax=Bacillus pumilus (strain SAFR-032) TaxID=315750 RepID=A8FH70_BACP2|nr:hypothetical protein BPUM_2933 [Bacillus pumilus SAFR-032]
MPSQTLFILPDAMLRAWLEVSKKDLTAMQAERPFMFNTPFSHLSKHCGFE